MYYEIAKKNNMEKNDAEKNSVENLGDIWISVQVKFNYPFHLNNTFIFFFSK